MATISSSVPMASSPATSLSEAPWKNDQRPHPQPHKLYLRFPAHIWNSVPSALQLRAAARPRPVTAPGKKLQKKRLQPLKLKSGATPPGQASTIVRPQRAPPRCKTRICRFHPGGPKRSQEGKFQNAITLTQACGLATCADCVVYNRHLLMGGEEELSFATVEGTGELEKPGTSQPAMHIDSLTLPQSRWPCNDVILHATIRSPSRLLLPPPVCFLEPTSYDCNVTLDVHDEKVDELFQSQSVPSLSPDSFTPGDCSPKSILKSPLKKKMGDMKGIMDEQEPPRKKVRFRHRVMCLFKSQRGKEGFKQVVETRGG